MSDDFIVLIPADPSARPDTDTLKQLEQAHARITGAKATRLKDFGNRLQFIDCGGNFEETRCPACSDTVETSWWGHRMDHAWDDDHGFHMCEFDMPCCGASARLDTLDYRPHQGFATWFISAMNGGRDPLSDAEIEELEAVATAPLRVIYQHY